MKIIGTSTVQSHTVLGELGNRFTFILEEGEDWLDLHMSGDSGAHHNTWPLIGADALDFLSSINYDSFWNKMSDVDEKHLGYDVDAEKTRDFLKSEISEEYIRILENTPSLKEKARDEKEELFDVIDSMSGSNMSEQRVLLYDKLDVFSEFFDEGIEFKYEECPRSRFAFDALKFLIADLQLNNKLYTDSQIELSFQNTNPENISTYNFNFFSNVKAHNSVYGKYFYDEKTGKGTLGKDSIAFLSEEGVNVVEFLKNISKVKLEKEHIVDASLWVHIDKEKREDKKNNTFIDIYHEENLPGDRLQFSFTLYSPRGDHEPMVGTYTYSDNPDNEKYILNSESEDILKSLGVSADDFIKGIPELDLPFEHTSTAPFWCSLDMSLGLTIESSSCMKEDVNTISGNSLKQ